jgi:hypothetical protein
MREASDLLETFLDSVGISLESLTDAVRYTDWSSSESVNAAREKLRATIEDAWRTCDRVARGQGWGLLRAVRNVVAVAGEEELVCYKLLLSHPGVQGSGLEAEFERIVTVLPELPPELGVLHRLICTSTRPTGEELRCFRANYPTEEQRERIEAGIQQVKRRDFRRSRPIQTLLDAATRSEVVWGELESAVLAETHPGTEKSRHASPALRRRIEGLPKSYHRDSLLLQALPTEERLDFLASLKVGTRSKLLRKLPMRDLVEAIVRERSRDRRTKVVDIVGAAGRFHAFVNACLAENPNEQLPTDLAERFLLESKPNVIRERIDLLPHVVASMPPSGDLARKVLQVVRAELKSPETDWVSVVKALPTAIIKHCPPNARGTGVVLRKVLEGVGGNLYEEFKDALLKAGPRVVSWVFTNTGLSMAEFEIICRHLDDVDSSRCLLELKTYRGQWVWKTYVRWLGKQKQSIPPIFLTVLREADVDTVKEAAGFYPGPLAQDVAHRLALRDALCLAFRGPEIAWAVMHSVPRKRLLGELDWVREKWARAPSIAAAYEVALAFSLADARYLVHLARETKEQERGERKGHTFDDLYRTYKLPKDAGGTRLITAPGDRLKRLQRRLLDSGFGRVVLPEAAKGFRSGESIVTNALPHTDQQMVVNVDIKSFFPNTGYGRIVDACGQLLGGRLSRRAVCLVADICSYGGGLPTGAPTSPAIANIVLSRVDWALTKAAAKYDITYTRYADDLTFSGHGDTQKIIPFAARLLAELGYELDPRKINIFRRGRRQIVTGLVVNEKVNLPRTLRRKLRAAVHNRSAGRGVHWHGKRMGDAELIGRIAFLNQVRPDEAKVHRDRLASAGLRYEMDGTRDG